MLLLLKGIYAKVENIAKISNKNAIIAQMKTHLMHEV